MLFTQTRCCYYYRDVSQNQNQYENITDSDVCFPDGTDWKCVPNGDYSSCGPRCLNFV